jgi:DNA polymerase-3 subunit delta'
MALEAIEGQPRAVSLLRRALESGRVAHAYAFVGPAGSGRTATALAFAQALLCETPLREPPLRETNVACGQCRGCRLGAAGKHPDLHVIVPTPPESNPKGARAIRIGAVRALEREAALRPVMARQKIFVLDDADRMTGESPQAILKTLEEPPAHTVLILILARTRAVPATVISRCQLVRFAPREDGQAEVRNEAVALLAEVRDKGVEALFRRSQAFDRDRERAERVVDALWLFARDLLVARAGGPLALLVYRGQAETIAREAERWTLDGILAVIDLCREAREALAVNVTPRLTVEIVASRLALGAA